ncbi:hypothetical protein BC940DRAFT_335670 [Gongronella butleri]|nr:hypothetical protein BC940DRAFT_335670 [Gongronella butleri]
MLPGQTEQGRSQDPDAPEEASYNVLSDTASFFFDDSIQEDPMDVDDDMGSAESHHYDVTDDDNDDASDNASLLIDDESFDALFLPQDGQQDDTTVQQVPPNPPENPEANDDGAAAQNDLQNLQIPPCITRLELTRRFIITGRQRQTSTVVSFVPRNEAPVNFPARAEYADGQITLRMGYFIGVYAGDGNHTANNVRRIAIAFKVTETPFLIDLILYIGVNHFTLEFLADYQSAISGGETVGIGRNGKVRWVTYDDHFQAWWMETGLTSSKILRADVTRLNREFARIELNVGRAAFTVIFAAIILGFLHADGSVSYKWVGSAMLPRVTFSNICLHSTDRDFMVWMQSKIRDLYGMSSTMNLMTREPPLLNVWRLILSNRNTAQSMLAPAFVALVNAGLPLHGKIAFLYRLLAFNQVSESYMPRAQAARQSLPEFLGEHAATAEGRLIGSDLYKLNFASLAAWVALLGIPIEMTSIWSLQTHDAIEWIRDNVNWWPVLQQYCLNIMQRVVPGSINMPLPDWSAIANPPFDHHTDIIPSENIVTGQLGALDLQQTIFQAYVDYSIFTYTTVEENGRRQCDACGNTLHPNAWRNHARLHLFSCEPQLFNDYCCHPCGRLFPHRQAENVHMQSPGHHATVNLPPENVAICATCGGRHLDAATMERHRQTAEHIYQERRQAQNQDQQ